MAANAVWTIQLRMMTASTAPRTFAQLAKFAKESATALESATKHAKGFGDAAKTATPEVKGLSAASRGVARALGKMPTDTDRVMGRVARGFQGASRAAGGFARTTRVVSTAAAQNFRVVDSSLNTVRATANATASAVRGIASAARSIPKTINVRSNVGAGGAAAAGGINPVTLGAAAGGALAGGMLLTGFKGAANVQDASTQIALGLAMSGGSFSAAQRNTAGFRQQAMALSMMTAQDYATSLGLVQSMSTSIKDPRQLQAIMPDVARVADVLYLGPHHTAFAESVPDMARLAHMFGAYSAQDMKPLAEATYRLGYSSPDRLSRMVTQLGYFGEDYARSMMKPGDSAAQRASAVNETLRLALLGDISIGHGKWGSGYDRMIRDLIHPTSIGKLEGQISMGLRDKRGNLIPGIAVDADGRFTPERMLRYLSDKYENMAPMKRMGVFASGFNVTAARVLGGAASPKALRYLGQVQNTMAHMDPLDVAQGSLMGSLNSQTKLLTTNFHTLATVIADAFTPEVTKAIAGLASFVGGLAKFLYAHPRAAKIGGVGLAGTAVAGGLAALTLGGYVAHGAFRHLLHPIGNHALEHEVAGAASEATRSGGLMALLRRGGSFAGSAGRFAWNTGMRMTGLSMGANLLRRGAGMLGRVPGMSNVGGGVARIASAVLHALAPLSGGLGRFALILGRLGLRVIPVVGEILMLIDTIKFLGAHSHDIGKGIGIAARWIATAGVSLIVGGFKAIVMGVVHLLEGIGATVGGIFNGGHGGAWDAIRGFFGGIGEGWSGKSAAPGKPSNVVPMRPGMGPPVAMATGGRVNANGLAFLHRGEVVVNDRLTRQLERATAPGGGGVGGRTMRIVLASDGLDVENLSTRALKRLAAAIADEIGHDVELDTRAGGSTPAIIGSSVHGIQQGNVA